MKKTKKSQFALLSIVFLIFTISFLYQIENNNNYINNFREYYMIKGIEFESCSYLKSINGNRSFVKIQDMFVQNKNYCDEIGLDCGFSYKNSSNFPSNLSKLNHTHFDIFFNITKNGLKLNSKIKC